PVVVIGLVIALTLTVMVLASRYKTVPPNAIGVFYGRRYRYREEDGSFQHRGFKIVTGGGAIIWPVIEKYQVMSTAAFQVEIQEDNVPTRKNVPVMITANVTCRISTTSGEQSNAVQAFLGKEQEEISATIKEILRGHMRTIIASLEVEEILRERSIFNTRVLTESAEEFRRLGIQIITLVVQDVRDSNGYIEALGKKEIAEKIRDAKIQMAEAERDTAIKTSNAVKESEMVEASNAAKVAEAQKDRDVQVAQFKVATEQQRAQAETAFQIAKTEQEKRLLLAQAQRDNEATQAQVTVQEKKAELKDRELRATLLTEADAKKKAQIIAAEADRDVAERQARRRELDAEGVRNATITEGEGQAKKALIVAEANATAIQKTALAEAAGREANLVAAAKGKEADLFAAARGKEADLMAAAKGKQAYLEGEAAGTEKMAIALAKLSQDGKLILILDRLPGLLKEGGDAGAKIVGAACEPIGNALGSIKDVHITKFGGSGEGKGGLSGFATSLPTIVAEVFAKAKAAGIDITPLLTLLKINPEKLGGMIGEAKAADPVMAAASDFFQRAKDAKVDVSPIAELLKQDPAVLAEMARSIAPAKE
ncbi:MAG TPA: SPFH domain-containing protein, partial [Opitutales bacterium]|nr:SPFH domain-containing protein [Opitutales bacterium]